MQILDWDDKLGVDKFLAHHHANGNNKPKTLLVNGRGHFHQFQDVNFSTRNVTYSPAATFTVQQVPWFLKIILVLYLFHVLSGDQVTLLRILLVPFRLFLKKTKYSIRISHDHAYILPSLSKYDTELFLQLETNC